MNESFFYALALLSVLGLISALVLYFVAQKFKVEEDPRIDLVNECLPGANCGACGKAGCRDMAECIVKNKSTSVICPACTQNEVSKIAEILGIASEQKIKKIAVVRCAGGKKNSSQKVKFEGAANCAFANGLYGGENGCAYGCLGLGDCVKACNFDAIHINELTALPEVEEDKCTACGACARSCPRNIIEIRCKNEDSSRIYVRCMNQQKGAISTKVCKVSCIGCGKCVKVCPQSAISLNNNLAYINDTLCIHCRKCVEECPTHALSIDFSGIITKNNA
ncbi:MAG: RnfABCDGE type electron transport complex subunit B [Bacteroidales bacterium]